MGVPVILTPEVLHVVAPKADPSWASHLTFAATEWRIDTPLRMAAWLANIAEESAGLTRLEENLNYSATRLVEVFPKRFTLALANTYEHKPERIANYLYSGRYGNGDEASGDGWRFKGRGPIQLTFRDNYRAAGKALGFNLEVEPERVLEPFTGARTAGWFYASKGLNELADKGDFKTLCVKVNGGLLGYFERAQYYAKLRESLHA